MKRGSAQDPYTLDYVPYYLKLQEMCIKAVEEDPAAFVLVYERFKTKEMCIKAAEKDPWLLRHLSHHFKTQEISERAVEEGLYVLEFVADRFKTKEVCDKAVSHDPSSLRYVPDYFVTQGQVKASHDDDEVIGWNDGYQKRRAQRAKIKEELMPIAWHPSRWWDWCMSEEEKKERKIVFDHMIC